MRQLTRLLCHEFDDPELLNRALRHRSAGTPHNERLEFLGDAVLGMLIAEHLYAQFPGADEGQLTRTRASLVNRDTLAGVARELELGEAIVLGEGELKSGGWRRDSILANALEAVIGAVYLDGGLEACRQTLTAIYAKRLATVDPDAQDKDAKTTLQEFLQARQLGLPRYDTEAVSGPPHDREFTVSCHLECLEQPVTARGRSRRRAEQAAAEAALVALEAE